MALIPKKPTKVTDESITMNISPRVRIRHPRPEIKVSVSSLMQGDAFIIGDGDYDTDYCIKTVNGIISVCNGQKVELDAYTKVRPAVFNMSVRKLRA